MTKHDEDLLNRKEDVDIVEKFLAAQIGRNGGCVLNVDAGWGLGKTFFMEFLGERLDDHAVYVNAWETDHADDALLPVLAKVLEGLERLKCPSDISGIRTKVKKLGVRILIDFIEGATHAALDELANEEPTTKVKIVAGGMKKASGADGEFLLRRFARQESQIKEFKRLLTQAVAHLDKPFTILIDELDRCRPTYAIEMLERIKHLFDIPKVAFVVATDTEQLQHAIKAVYGEGFDAKAYLRRFFGRAYRFDTPDMETYVRHAFHARGLSDGDFVMPLEYSASEFAAKLFSELAMTLRDADQYLDLVADASSLKDVGYPLNLLLFLPMAILSEREGEHVWDEVISKESDDKISAAAKRMRDILGSIVVGRTTERRKVDRHLNLHPGVFESVSVSHTAQQVISQLNAASKDFSKFSSLGGNSEMYRVIHEIVRKSGPIGTVDTPGNQPQKAIISTYLDYPRLVRRVGRLSGGPKPPPSPPPES